jgi:hypothetical protein
MGDIRLEDVERTLAALAETLDGLSNAGDVAGTESARR